MFRDGQYLEIIKASDDCLATAVVTVQEKLIKIKKKRVPTNKWLDLEDWAALYKILKKAILHNAQEARTVENFEKCKWKESTRQLDVTYTIEPSKSVNDVTLLPTIRVNVSPAKRKSDKAQVPKTGLSQEIHDPTIKKSQNFFLNRTYQNNIKSVTAKRSKNTDIITKLPNIAKNNSCKRYLSVGTVETEGFEEYVPNAPTTKKLRPNLNYIPSRKSMLERIQVTSNEYSPMVSDTRNVTEVVRYIPNSMDSSKISYEIYEPSTSIITNNSEEYVPNSKGIKASVEEYHPDFTSKLMKFDDSYVPSSVKLTNEHSKNCVKRHTKL